jgi:predicted O-linked N-acetylglucosamine transferase (SPINDLY family)
MLCLHDRIGYQVHAYSTTERPDHWTDRLRRRVECWHDVARWSDADIAHRIIDDEIDILVFVAGSTDGNRGELRAHRLAPVQVSFLDLGSSGFDTVDYWLTDSQLHPEGTIERFSEALVRLPVFQTHQEPDSAPDVTAPPSEHTNRLTFGCLNAPAKLSAAALDAWAGILRAVPNSTLFLKYASRYSASEVRDRLVDMMARRGIEPARMIFHAGVERRDRHLARVATVDIALDTSPYSGCTATFEALWMGVPVVARAGDRFVARMSSAILTQAGLDNLVAASWPDYVAIALELARDADRRASLRIGMRDRIRQSLLCDHAAHTRSTETAYREMWRRWCGGHAPRPFRVASDGTLTREPGSR